MERRRRGPLLIAVSCRACGQPVELDPWKMEPREADYAIVCVHCGADRVVRRSDPFREDLRDYFGSRRRRAAFEAMRSNAVRPTRLRRLIRRADSAG